MEAPSVPGPTGSDLEHGAAKSNAGKVYAIQLGDRVVAKFPAFRGKEDDPFFAGTLTTISTDRATCVVTFSDGDKADGILPGEVFYAPDAPNDVGGRVLPWRRGAAGCAGGDALWFGVPNGEGSLTRRRVGPRIHRPWPDPPSGTQVLSDRLEKLVAVLKGRLAPRNA